MSAEDLYEFVFSVFEDDDQYAAVHKQHHLAGASLVRHCMVEQGFEYSTELVIPDDALEQPELVDQHEPTEPEDPNLAIQASASAIADCDSVHCRPTVSPCGVGLRR